jgi:tRNA threonylcarbamoyladenosine biosynthesis protein TsaB
MLILSADTSGKHGSVALVKFQGAPETEAFDRKDREEQAQSWQITTAETIELVGLEGGTFSAQLIPQIAELLSKHRLSKGAIDAFAVASGPGSFTGLRVGLAAIKALAEILQKPIAAVSLLEVMAFELLFPVDAKAMSDTADSILVALDAGRNEAYVGEYSTGAEFPVRVSESLLTVEELVERARHTQSRIYTPDEILCAKSSEAAGTRFIQVQRPNAVAVARLGFRKIVAGQTVSPMELDANYIRRADAEIKSSERSRI